MSVSSFRLYFRQKQLAPDSWLGAAQIPRRHEQVASSRVLLFPGIPGPLKLSLPS
jgi:hypothetical protein